MTKLFYVQCTFYLIFKMHETVWKAVIKNIMYTTIASRNLLSYLYDSFRSIVILIVLIEFELHRLYATSYPNYQTVYETMIILKLI